MAKRRRPEYLEVKINGEMVYALAEKVLADGDLRGQVINKALAEISAWRDRYANLFPLLNQAQAKKIINTFADVKKEMGNITH
jgi:hypothetical protein